jgi:hypothetical protein
LEAPDPEGPSSAAKAVSLVQRRNVAKANIECRIMNACLPDVGQVEF